MTLGVLLESFEGFATDFGNCPAPAVLYDPAHPTRAYNRAVRWSYTNGLVSAAAARTGSRGLVAPSGLYARYTEVPDQTNDGFYINRAVGLALRNPTGTPLSSSVPYLTLLDNAGQQVRLEINVSGGFDLYIGGTYVVSSAVGLVGGGAWTHIIVNSFINASTGYVRVYINSVLSFSYSGNTKGSSTVRITKIELQAPVGWYVDDIYAIPSSSTTFGRDLSIEALWPASQVSATRLVVVGAGTSWQAVNQRYPNSGSYIQVRNNYPTGGGLGATVAFNLTHLQPFLTGDIPVYQQFSMISRTDVPGVHDTLSSAQQIYSMGDPTGFVLWSKTAGTPDLWTFDDTDRMYVQGYGRVFSETQYNTQELDISSPSDNAGAVNLRVAQIYMEVAVYRVPRPGGARRTPQTVGQ